MAIIAGQKVTDVDFNALINELNSVYSTGTGNSGYGAIALPTVASGTNKIKSNDWLTLRTAIINMGTHQGDVPTLPAANVLEVGDPIAAFTDFPTAITQVATNNLTVDIANTVSDASVLTSQRTANWSNEINHVFTADFTSDDDARHFFNTGGRITVDMSGPTNDAGHQWGILYNEAQGPFIFDWIAYYNLNPTLGVSTTLATFISSGSVYSDQNNRWVISARFITGTSDNGARGSKIEITSKSIDQYSGNPSFPGSPDIVAGTFDSIIGERRSDTVFPVSSPTYATVTELTVGS